MSPGSPRTGCARLAVGLFLVPWCAAAAAFDGFAAWAEFRQCRAYAFETTTGTVTRSDIDEQHGPDGDSHSLLVRYSYAVNGRAYVGDRYRYFVLGTNDRTWHRVQQQLPVGAVVPVFYDPGDPADAVLVRGPMGLDLFVLWFLTPFNVIAVGGLLVVVRGRRPAFDPGDRRTLAPTDAGWQFRPGGRTGPAVFGGVMLGLTLVGVFVIGFTLGFNPPLAVMAGAWVAAVGAAAAAAVWFSRRPVLEVDLVRMTVALCKGEAGESVPLAAVAGCSVEEEVTTDSEGHSKPYYHVLLRWGTPPRAARVTWYSDRNAAEAVAAGLGAALAAAAKGEAVGPA